MPAVSGIHPRERMNLVTNRMIPGCMFIEDIRFTRFDEDTKKMYRSTAGVNCETVIVYCLAIGST
jgi:hypothetical protein